MRRHRARDGRVEEKSYFVHEELRYCAYVKLNVFVPRREQILTSSIAVVSGSVVAQTGMIEEWSLFKRFVMYPLGKQSFKYLC